MGALELVVLLGAVILACGLLGHRTGMPEPILLLLAGVALGFIPALQEVHLPPELMLLVFLPALLYWEAITTSVRGIRASLRGTLLSSTLLVVATAGAAAWAAQAVLRLRDARQIDDAVLRQVQARLDIQEIRLTRASDALVE